MNKMLTVTVNVLIWDKHASPAGILSLGVCLAGGTLYKQSPPRDAPIVSKSSHELIKGDSENSDYELDHEEETRSLTRCK
mmetsp:Transcript_28838/g.58032  ORF Transcript_28838/g.58032 Transcript_28838/m.58032 type:complete len:80 (+) Transcript_28838:1000-1239(+)